MKLSTELILRLGIHPSMVLAYLVANDDGNGYKFNPNNLAGNGDFELVSKCQIYDGLRKLKTLGLVTRWSEDRIPVYQVTQKGWDMFCILNGEE